MARTSAVKLSISAEDRTKNAFKSATRGIQNLQNKFAALVPPISALAGAAGIGALVRQATQLGDQFDKMSLRTGVAVEQLTALDYAAQITGTNIESVEKSLKYLSQQMLDVSRGTGEAKDTFADMGISVIDAQGNLRDTVDVMLQAADVISAMDDETRQAAYAMDIFGSRSGQSLIPMLKEGSDGMQELMERAQELGHVMSAEDAAAAAEFNDSLTDLKASLGGLGRTVGMEIIPHLNDAAVSMTDWVSGNREFIGLEIEDKLEDIAESIKTISEYKNVIGTAVGAGVMVTALPMLVKYSTVLWGVAAASEMIRSKGKAAPISGRWMDRVNAMQFEGFGGGYAGSGGVSGSFGEPPLNADLPSGGRAPENRLKQPSLGAAPTLPLSVNIPDTASLEVFDKIQVEYEELETISSGVTEDMLAQWQGMTEQMLNDSVRFGNRWGSTLTSMYQQADGNFKRIHDMFGQMLKQMAIEAALSGVFNLLTGGLGGFAGGFKASFGRGLGFRADGGPVTGGKPYIVGERGPELFVPKMSGDIVPNKRTPQTVNDNRSMSVAISVDRPISTMDEYQLAEMINRAQHLGLIEGMGGAYGDR